MSTVPTATRGLVFDPNHESPDLIDERPASDPTRQQTGGSVPVLVTPGAPQPVFVDAAPVLPIFHGWNIWDVLQSQVPIDPVPGTLDQQLATWVRDAAGLPADHPIAKVSSAAAGGLVTSRATFPELAGPLNLGVNGSQVLKRTVAFESNDARSARPWPHDGNTALDAVYLPAPAPQPTPSMPGPVPTPDTTHPALPVPAGSSSSSSVLMLGLGVGLGAILLARGKGRRR